MFLINNSYTKRFIKKNKVDEKMNFIRHILVHATFCIWALCTLTYTLFRKKYINLYASFNNHTKLFWHKISDSSNSRYSNSLYGRPPLLSEDNQNETEINSESTIVNNLISNIMIAESSDLNLIYDTLRKTVFHIIHARVTMTNNIYEDLLNKKRIRHDIILIDPGEEESNTLNKSQKTKDVDIENMKINLHIDQIHFENTTNGLKIQLKYSFRTIGNMRNSKNTNQEEIIQHELIYKFKTEIEILILVFIGNRIQTINSITNPHISLGKNITFIIEFSSPKQLIYIEQAEKYYTRVLFLFIVLVILYFVHSTIIRLLQN